MVLVHRTRSHLALSLHLVRQLAFGDDALSLSEFRLLLLPFVYALILLKLIKNVWLCLVL